jgi:hypothetical protein
MGTNKQPEELLEHIKLSVKSNVLFLFKKYPLFISLQF